MEENKNSLTTFESAAFGALRTTLDEENNPLFCLKDACSILDIKNPSDAKTRLDSKGVRLLDNPTSKKGGKLIFISEANLYRLIFQSRKEEAEGFVSWVVEDVLPEIRKYGRYDVKLITSSESTANAFLEEFNALKTKNEILLKEKEETKEMKDYIKRNLDSGVLKDLYDVPTILGINLATAEVFKILRAKGVLDSNNEPAQVYIDKGCFRVDTHTYTDKLGALVMKKRTYCYKSGINLIKKTLEEYAGGKNNG